MRAIPPPPYPPPAFDAVAVLGIGGLAVLVAAIVVWLRARYEGGAAARSAALVLAAWMAAAAALARAGVLQRFDVTPPPMAMLIAIVFVVPFALAFSPIGRRLAQAWPVIALVGLQAFRLPLELVMHRAGELGIMPVELSYSGYNRDILTGAGALLLALAMRRGPVAGWLVWAWNLWGLWCLAVIAWVAVSSSPMVRAFGDDPRHVNTWVLHVPYVWLPAVLVMVALAGHLILARKLLTVAEPAPYTSSHR
jgi:hypothetical protein